MQKTLSLLCATICIVHTLLSQDAHALLSRRPVLFLENKGQMTNVQGEQVPSVLFRTTAPGIAAYITENGLVYVFTREQKQEGAADPLTIRPQETEWVQVHLAGAQIRRENIVKERPAQGDFRYFSEHAPDGITGVREYEKITVKNVYPGIDWVLYGSSATGMKYDFVVHPGADPLQVKLVYESDRPVVLNAEGGIDVQARLGTITEQAPVSFLEDDHSAIASAFERRQVDDFQVEVTYRLGPFPKDRTLVIDPQLTWGTRFGHDGADVMQGITHDSNDNIFITGSTAAAAFPVLDAGTYYQPTLTGFGFDAFILKFDNNGVLLWSTYYGGTGAGFGYSVVCDPNDNIFVGGTAGSVDFPLQDAGTFFQACTGDDGFILKFDNAGNRLWATCYGGNMVERIMSLACDPSGNLFVSGYTVSADFPLQNNATYFQPNAGGIDAFLLKFDNAGNRLWATCYGGTGEEMGNSIACDASGNLLVTGYTQSANLPTLNGGAYFDGTFGGDRDAFVLKFDNNGARLWATYYGGNGRDQGQTIIADLTGNIFVTGYAGSANFPVQDAGTYFDGTLGGDNDQFILKFDGAGTRLWATLYGGSNMEIPFSFPYTSLDNLAVDACGNIYVSFMTRSTDMTTLDPGNGSYFDGTLGVNVFDGDFFLTRFTNDGTLLWGTYIGGDEYNYYESIELDNRNNLFMTGTWGWYTGTDLLVDPGGGAFFDVVTHQNNDGYIFKFAPDPLVLTSSQTAAGCNCSGTATVTVTSGMPTYTYTWSTGAQTVGTSDPVNTITGVCAGQLWVEVATCDDRDTVFFDFPAGTPPEVQISVDDTSACPGTELSFSANTVAGAVYNWSFGGGQTSAEEDPELTYTTPGSYDVALTITDALGCSASETIVGYIDVHPRPVAAFIASAYETTISHPVIDFTELASGENAWLWKFGDPFNGESTLPDPSYAYTVPGRYTVSLIVSNAFGCTDTAQALITIYDDFAFYAPNTFTPNASSINDTWLPLGSGIDPSSYQLTIFNRWGETVFHTTTWGEGWDGYNAQEGTYTWKAVVASESGRFMDEVSGSVTLLR